MKTQKIYPVNSPNATLEQLITVGPDAQLDYALELMARYGIRHLPVLNGDRFIGLIEDSEVAKALVSLPPGLKKVEEFMRKDMPMITEETDVRETLRLMLDNHLSALPVVRDGKFLGIVTETDLLRLLYGLLGKTDALDNVVNRSEEFLSTPIVQSVVRTLSDMGI